MKATDLHEARSFAKGLAREAAEISRSMRGSVLATRKADDSPLTEADLQIQRLFADRILNRYPDHSFIGEEQTGSQHGRPAPGETDYCWVVDPLDGTRNFMQGFPVWCTSVALIHKNNPVLALVHEHNSGWEVSSIVGEGVCCNGRSVAVASRPIDADTLIATPSGRKQSVLPIIQNWIDRYVIRNVGSTAMHMAYLATGAVDAVFCNECEIWDVAAGVLLIAEAGGRCSDLQGKPLLDCGIGEYSHRDLPFFAASPTVYEDLLSEIPAEVSR